MCQNRYITEERWMWCKMVWPSKLVKSCLELLFKAKLCGCHRVVHRYTKFIVTGTATYVFLSRVILAALDNCLYIIPRIFHHAVFSDCQVQCYIILMRMFISVLILVVSFAFILGYPTLCRTGVCNLFEHPAKSC